MLTLKDFLNAAKTATSEELYEMFEAAPDGLRDRIFAAAESLGVVLAEESEPTRESFYAIGRHYNIQSLMDY
jgi:hypothetical protein